MLFHCINQCKELHFASLLSGGFTTMAIINPPEKKLTNRTSVQWEVLKCRDFSRPEIHIFLGSVVFSLWYFIILILDFICGTIVLLIIKQRCKNANWYNMYFDRTKFTAQNEVIKQTFETLYSKVECIQNMANYFIRLPFFLTICSTKETTLRTFPSYRQINRFIKSG